ncbi:MAG TPA: hypothetical protein VGF67_02520 [Ktedonobacteraceae bacterium]|jgi:hypothetical protein
MSEIASSKIEGLDTSLASKVREIIEGQWGRCLEDIKDWYVGQFHERLVEGDQVSYKPTNRFLLQVRFIAARYPRRTTFSLAV